MNPTPQNLNPLPTGRVLVVDDDAKNRELLCEVLQAHGYRVAEAIDGERALEAVAGDAPDVVILDVMMPRLDGFEVCRRLKADPRTAPIPVLLVTALADRRDRLAGIAAGANDFLTKPIDIQDVLLRVRNAAYTKRLFDELSEKYDRLRELEAQRDGMASMLVHDLRQPLMSFIAGLQTVETLGPLAPAQAEFLQMAVQGGQSLSRMIDGLLDISAYEGGSLTLECREIDARALVEQALRRMTGLVQEKRQTLRAEISLDLPRFQGDEERLLRTLENLLGNASKFTPEGGSIAVTTRPCEANAILFTVADSGEGIPREAFERIFEKFVQVESRRAGRTRSAGLGLASCKIAVEAHGGRIWVESEPGRGSTFSFTIPMRKA